MAVAYVSTSGFSLVKNILDEGGVGVWLVTDTKDGATHPKALQSAVDSGWNARVVDNLAEGHLIPNCMWLRMVSTMPELPVLLS